MGEAIDNIKFFIKKNIETRELLTRAQVFPGMSSFKDLWMDTLFVARVVLRSVERLLTQVTEHPIEGRGEFSMGMRTFTLDMPSKVLVSRKGFSTFENWTKVAPVGHSV